MAPTLLAGFRALHPAVTIHLIESTQPELEEAMLAGTIDVSILYDVDLVSAIERRNLLNCLPYVLLPPDHDLAKQPGPVDLRDLIDDPYIQMEVLPGRDDHIFSALGLKPRMVVQRTTNFELVRALVARGLGYSILVQRPSLDFTYDGLPVITRAIANLTPPLRVIVGWPSKMRLHRRAAAFVDFSASAFVAPTPR
jgi:DNA-binding transcriptional LysR family regulator